MSERWSVLQGDCREQLRTLADASVDAVVCDPPYELGFMAKAWDSSGIAYDPVVWRECYRVLKPGGHLIAFGGSRTYHRLACAVEDAGFEVRDQVLWLYGSGFPKSLDVSKAIDKLRDDGSAVTGNNDPEVLRFTQWLRSTGITRQQIREATGTFMDSHYLSSGSQPAIPTAQHWAVIRSLLTVEIPEWAERAAERAALLARREVLKVETRRKLLSGIVSAGRESPILIESAITAPATYAARQWSGWGTALKPAHEPAVLARKPLVGTVAENVLAHGTGGINVDGCRVGTETITTRGHKPADSFAGGCPADATGSHKWNGNDGHTKTGRWPANLIHDGSEAAVAIFPGEDDDSAARFFYCAKASRADREFGLSDDTPEVSPADRVNRTEGSAGMDSPRAGAGRTAAGRNGHPTVKPIALMRHLVRLVTPPGGLVLDPFTGSGSTGVAAILEGFRFVGCELQPEYHALACRRVGYAEADRKHGEDERSGMTQLALFD